MKRFRSRLLLLSVCGAAGVPLFGGTIPFTFHVDGNLSLLSPAPLINFHVTGTGTTSAGPIVAYSDSGTIDFTKPFADTTFPLAGNLIMTLASGDQINANLLEHFVPPDAQGNVSGTEVFTVTGGTGMFAGATGVLYGFGSGNANTGSVQFGATGALTGPNIASASQKCSVATLNGTYMFRLNGAVETQTSPLVFGAFVDAGIFTADGKGSISVHDSGNSSGAVFTNRTFAITYVINEDCTGTFKWPGASMDVEVSKDGSRVNMVFTAPATVVANGSATLQ